MTVFHYDPTEAAKVRAIPEGDDFDDDDHFTGAVICAAITVAAFTMGLMLLIFALVVRGCA